MNETGEQLPANQANLVPAEGGVFMGLELQKILVLSPHTDDAELAAGGTISRFIEEGKEIHYIVFSSCEASLPEGFPKDTLRKECSASLAVLGLRPDRVHFLNYRVRTFPEKRQSILEDLISFKGCCVPSLVLVPSSNDMHQDHGVIYWEALRAFKKESSIWGYEHPWNNLTFTTDIFVKLGEKHLEKKLRALREYHSQSMRGYMDESRIRSLLVARGSQIEMPYAESFELIRLVY